MPPQRKPKPPDARTRHGGRQRIAGKRFNRPLYAYMSPEDREDVYLAAELDRLSASTWAGRILVAAAREKIATYKQVVTRLQDEAPEFLRSVERGQPSSLLKAFLAKATTPK